ncbi:MAG: glycosyltransferase [Alphaproteobacteria bacterium]|nr:glycosyltransferase [Alphaproteobacteria bacterium]
MKNEISGIFPKVTEKSFPIINVKNTKGCPKTVAEIIVCNKIDYIPKVSVITPVYNVEQYLHESLNSIVNQTLREIEIICIDDGSTDNSFEILKEYAAKDNRITILKQKNFHAGVARNAGITVAKGEYLIFLDADDTFEPNMLDEMIKIATKDNSDIVMCNALKNVDGELQEGNFVREKYIKNNIFSCYEKDTASHIFQTIYGFPWNKLIAHSLINKHKLRFSSIDHHNDTSFIMTSIVAARQISYTPAKYVYYRYRSDSLCHAAKDLSCMYKSLHETHELISKLKNYKYIKHSFLNYVIEFTLYYYNKRTITAKEKLLLYINQLFQELKIKDNPASSYYDISSYKKMENLIDIYNSNTITEKAFNIKSNNNFLKATLLFSYYLLAAAYLRHKKKNLLTK